MRQRAFYIFWACLLLWAMALIHVYGEEPAKYVPTELQELRLQVKLKDAQLAQKDYFIAQQNLNFALKSLNDEAARVKTENKWPDGLVFNQEKLSFTEEPKGRVQ